VRRTETAVPPKCRSPGYAGQTRRGDFVIQLAGPYDIAVNRQPDGTFGLTTDWWQGHVEIQVGSNFGKLLQLYAVHKATAEARKKGFSVLRQPQRNGAHQARAARRCRMKRSIEILIAPDGKFTIDAVGFKGADCDQATKFLEEALGLTTGIADMKRRKPEYHQTTPRQKPTKARHMITAVLKFDPAGNGHGLFTEAIDLSSLGALEIVRASSIEFNNTPSSGRSKTGG
jgi:hypothetical protein